MSVIVNYPHLTRDESGAVRIDNTRYKVIHLASEHYHYGWSAEELMRQHPDLRPEQVYAALTYFYDHFDELVQSMANHAAYGRGTGALPSGLSICGPDADPSPPVTEVTI